MSRYGDEREVMEIHVARRIFVGNLAWSVSWQVRWDGGQCGDGRVEEVGGSLRGCEGPAGPCVMWRHGRPG